MHGSPEEPEGPVQDPIAEVRLEGERPSARAARAFVIDTLERLGLRALEDDAALLVSELVANVVLHARTEFTIRVRPMDDRLRIEVTDGNAVLPQRRHFDDVATTGRGLRLVSSISAAWGVDVRNDGKCVWFELNPPPVGERDSTSTDTERDAPVDLDVLAAAGGWDDDSDVPAVRRHGRIAA